MFYLSPVKRIENQFTCFCDLTDLIWASFYAYCFQNFSPFHKIFKIPEGWESKIKHFLCSLGLWTTSMTTHLTGPCWNRKQLNREPHPGAKASRHKPPQASKLTNPSLTWKVSSKQPSDVFLQTPIAYTFIRACAQTVWRLFFEAQGIFIIFWLCFYYY